MKNNILKGCCSLILLNMFLLPPHRREAEENK
ncbi:hypothetical protein GLYMA_07G037250v4 [Glycine max]|nr:hypothetical protein GLYMA_07G037250v4 [Glycine max]KAH1085264.1 hypothetical protein GYH30_017314 [Glycine max]